MRKSAIGKLVVLAGVAAASLAARSANPIFTDTFTADPAPVVVGDTCYVITTQDENDGTPGQKRPSLSEREIEIVRLVAKGFSNDESPSRSDGPPVWCLRWCGRGCRRSGSCDFASQSSSLRSSANLTPSYPPSVASAAGGSMRGAQANPATAQKGESRLAK